MSRFEFDPTTHEPFTQEPANDPGEAAPRAAGSRPVTTPELAPRQPERPSLLPGSLQEVRAVRQTRRGARA